MAAGCCSEHCWQITGKCSVHRTGQHSHRMWSGRLLQQDCPAFAKQPPGHDTADGYDA